MRLADITNEIIIDPRKLTHYALNPASPYGKHKAVLFERRLGFTNDNYHNLQVQLEAKALQVEAVFHSEDRFGKRYTVDIEVKGVEGQQEVVRTGWLVPPGSKQAHLVTLYVKRE